MINVKLDPWVLEILRDPLSKSPLEIDSRFLISDYGRRYPVVSGIYDLRLLNSYVGVSGELWRRGQIEYEKWSARVAALPGEYDAVQRRGVEDVYRAIPVRGRCLDVGGNDGRLRAFLDPDQEYISVDPYLEVVNEPRTVGCKTVYPFIDDPLNFLAATAEHLPFSSQSFDVVHMRSVIDHLMNPELALREAFRVLRAAGSLVIGLLVKGGRTGRGDLREHGKEALRSTLVAVGFDRFQDHHIWHPTYKELCQLISSCGFSIADTHWQKSENDRVCYIKAIK
jgi:SAM-dependent methyltransferase